MRKPKEYTINSYLINPPHPISILLIGAGGTGSLLLTYLARLHLSLRALEHPGLQVTVYDPDIVEQSNVGRQAFSKHDLGLNKAMVNVTRINLFYNVKWNWRDYTFMSLGYHSSSNIIITCTDNIKSRIDLKKSFDALSKKPYRIDGDTTLYWIDVGNLKDRGQIVLSSSDGKLKDVIDLFGKDYKEPDHAEEPSCSLAEALQKQDLCINPMMATFTQKLLWDMFTKIVLDYHGFLINLEDLTFNKLPI